VGSVYAAVIARVGCCGELAEEKSSDGGEVVMAERRDGSLEKPATRARPLETRPWLGSSVDDQ
jgi:hypothetical protein